MTIIPITREVPVCFGVVCPKHPDCARYLAVDNAPAFVHQIDNCSHDGGRTFPMFDQREDVTL